MPALDEAIRIGTEANIPVEDFSFEDGRQTELGKDARRDRQDRSGPRARLDITADQYPYVAGATSLGAAVPPWAHEGGTAKFIDG